MMSLFVRDVAAVVVVRIIYCCLVIKKSHLSFILSIIAAIYYNEDEIAYVGRSTSINISVNRVYGRYNIKSMILS